MVLTIVNVFWAKVPNLFVKAAIGSFFRSAESAVEAFNLLS